MLSSQQNTNAHCSARGRNEGEKRQGNTNRGRKGNIRFKRHVNSHMEFYFVLLGFYYFFKLIERKSLVDLIRIHLVLIILEISIYIHRMCC